MARKRQFSQEARERAIRMVLEHGFEWEAVRSIAGKIGCSAEALRKWVRRFEIDAGRLAGLSSDERTQI
jgi:transposase